MAAPSTPPITHIGGVDPYAPSPEETRRAHAIRRAWEAYTGVFNGGNEQWPLLWEKGKEPNPNVIVNRCGPAVDTDVAWLFGESVEITIPKGPKEAQQYVDTVWGVTADESSDDDKMALLQELATNGGAAGHSFLKIVWDEDGDQDYPELVVLDSSMVRVQTDPHNAKVPVCYIIEYSCPDPLRPGTTGTFRQVTELVDPDGVQKRTGRADPDDSWTITDYFKPSQGSTFVQQGDVREWPYPWAPIDGCPHLARPNAYWGRPRLTPDLIHLNEAICTVASNINKIALRHGHPILYTANQGNQQGELRHKPGTILRVASDIKAVEAYGDIAHLLQQEEDYRASFDEQSHIPSQAFGRQTDIPRTPVSGVAIRLSYGPLVADITKERRMYGALIRRVTQHLLELKNRAWAKLAVNLTWQDPMPADDLQQAQFVQLAVEMGVMSKQEGATKLGLDWQMMQDQMEEEDQAAQAAFAKGQGMAPTSPGAPGVIGQGAPSPHVPAPPGAGASGANAAPSAAAASGMPMAGAQQ